ncbi:MAG TPA: isocitrate/isopropylmalate family dehydrogenase [Acidimicrobiales bacterium]|nr:isocitrate/isopropylmalate family dehydrogenase [Acidimicrobiales bacterium]
MPLTPEPGPRRRVAVLPGDDAAPEAVHATLEILDAMDLPVDWAVLPDGDSLARKLSRPERDQLIRETVDSSDAALFGATSGKTGGVWYLRWGKDAYANVRPVRWRTGVPSPLREPAGIDYVIVRENLEDFYVGVEGDLSTLRASGLDLRPYGGLLDISPRYGPATAADGRFALKVLTKENTERVAHFACRLAMERRRRGYPGKLTCSCKYNVLAQSDGFFRRTVAAVAAEYPGLAYEEFIVDDFARRLVASPHELDVVLLPNLYGDILSDEAAATIGGLGVAPSGCYGDDFAYFEPVHGSAPDIAGRNVVNPVATMLSAAMLLEHLGFTSAASRLERAVDGALAAGDRLTPDLGGSGTTRSFTQAVLSRIGES